MSWVNINICVSPYISRQVRSPKIECRASHLGRHKQIAQGQPWQWRGRKQSSALGKGQFWHNPFITKEIITFRRKEGECHASPLGSVFFLHWVFTLNSRLQIKNGTFLSWLFSASLQNISSCWFQCQISVRYNSYPCCMGSLKTVFGKQIARQRFISGVFDDEEVSQTVLRNLQIRL